MAGSLADVWVDIRGRTDKLGRDIEEAAARAGDTGGRRGGDNFVNSFESRLRNGRARVGAEGDKAGREFAKEADKGASSGSGGRGPLGTFWRVVSFDAGRSGRGAAGSFLVGLAAAFAPALPGLALQLISALAPLVGAIGLIPAAALTAGAGLATFKIALGGVSDAISAGLDGNVKAFAKAVEGMAPSALSTVKAFVAMKTQLDALKTTVQGNFFAGLSTSVTALGRIYLPILQTALGRVATGLNGVLKSIASMARSPLFITHIPT